MPTKELVQCLRQLGASNTDAIAIAFAAGCLCSKIGDVRQAETLLRQAYSACKMAEVRDMTVLRISMDCDGFGFRGVGEGLLSASAVLRIRFGLVAEVAQFRLVGLTAARAGGVD